MYQGWGGGGRRPLPTLPEGLPLLGTPPNRAEGPQAWSPPAAPDSGKTEGGKDLPKATQLSVAELESNPVSVPSLP